MSEKIESLMTELENIKEQSRSLYDWSFDDCINNIKRAHEFLLALKKELSQKEQQNGIETEFIDGVLRERKSYVVTE